jgi:hypothetical protein
MSSFTVVIVLVINLTTIYAETSSGHYHCSFDEPLDGSRFILPDTSESIEGTMRFMAEWQIIPDREFPQRTEELCIGCKVILFVNGESRSLSSSSDRLAASTVIDTHSGTNELQLLILGSSGENLGQCYTSYIIEGSGDGLDWDALRSDLRDGRWASLHQRAATALLLGDRDLVRLRPMYAPYTSTPSDNSMLEILPQDDVDDPRHAPAQLHIFTLRDAAKDTAFSQPFLDRGATVHWWEAPAADTWPAGAGGAAFLDALRTLAGACDQPATGPDSDSGPEEASSSSGWGLFVVGGAAAHPALGAGALAEAVRMGLRLAAADGLLCLGACSDPQERGEGGGGGGPWVGC